MISLLETLVEAVEAIAGYVILALETVINLGFEGIQVLLEVAAEHLPGLPEVVTPPSFLTDINWYYPLGGVISIATPLVAAYTAFLAYRYLWKKYGAL